MPALWETFYMASLSSFALKTGEGKERFYHGANDAIGIEPVSILVAALCSIGTLKGNLRLLASMAEIALLLTACFQLEQAFINILYFPILPCII